MERRERSDRRGFSTAKREFVWGDATERAVGAVAVVVLAVRVGVGSGVSGATAKVDELLHQGAQQVCHNAGFEIGSEL